MRLLTGVFYHIVMIELTEFLIIYFIIGCFYSIFYAFYSYKFIYEVNNNKNLKHLFVNEKDIDYPSSLTTTFFVYLIIICPIWIFHYAFLRKKWGFVLYILEDKTDDVYE